MWKFLLGALAGATLANAYPAEVRRGATWAAGEAAPLLDRGAAALRGLPDGVDRPWEDEPNTNPYRTNGRPVPLHQ